MLKRGDRDSPKKKRMGVLLEVEDALVEIELVCGGLCILTGGDALLRRSIVLVTTARSWYDDDRDQQRPWSVQILPMRASPGRCNPSSRSSAATLL